MISDNSWKIKIIINWSWISGGGHESSKKLFCLIVGGELESIVLMIEIIPPHLHSLVVWFGNFDHIGSY